MAILRVPNCRGRNYRYDCDAKGISFGQFAFVYAQAFRETELIIAADIATKKNRNGSTD